MAVLKSKEIVKMPLKEREQKLKELKMELIKNRASKKTKVQTKEIKKAIARILTFNRINKSVEK